MFAAAWNNHGRLAGSNHVAALVPVAGWLRDFTGEATASVLFGGLMMILTVAALIAFRVIKRRWPAKEPGQLI